MGNYVRKWCVAIGLTAGIIVSFGWELAIAGAVYIMYLQGWF